MILLFCKTPSESFVFILSVHKSCTYPCLRLNKLGNTNETAHLQIDGINPVPEMYKATRTILLWHHALFNTINCTNPKFIQQEDSTKHKIYTKLSPFRFKAHPFVPHKVVCVLLEIVFTHILF